MDDRTRNKAQDFENFPKTTHRLWFVFPFLRGLITMCKFYKNGISTDNPCEFLEHHEAKQLGDKLEQAWQEESHSKRPSFWKAVLKVFRLRLAVTGIFHFIWVLPTTILQPLLIKYLMENSTVEQTKETKFWEYVYAASIFMVLLLRKVGYHCSYFYGTTTGIKVQTACTSMVYRKLLKLNTSKIEKNATGQIINLVSNDVKNLEIGFKFFHYFWVTPIETVVSTFVIVRLFGSVALAGAALLFVAVPLQSFLSKTISSQRMSITLKTDLRISLINEIVCGIRLIKMCTWEIPFAKLVGTARSSEIGKLKESNLLKFFLASSQIYVSRWAVLFLVFASVQTGTTLKAEHIFAVAVFYESLKGSVTSYFTNAIRNFSEIKTSLTRIEKFLTVDVSTNQELIKSKWFSNRQKSSNVVGLILKTEKLFTKKGINVTNVSAKWSADATTYSLHNISLNVGPKELVAVVGTTGSGKSTLLQLLMKEIEIETGSLCVEGTMSYASQEPWIFPASLKQNILFNQRFDAARYRKIISICALEHDISRFPNGDETLVGERGVTLSGGQKARINLARAVYKDADIYLLDDPFSAVDVHVSKQIFGECIADHLKEKCVVLVTHQLQYLPRVKKLYYLVDGTVAASGPFKKINHLRYFQNLSDQVHEIQKQINSVHKRKTENLPEKTELPCAAIEPGRKIINSWKCIKKYFLVAGHWTTSLAILAVFALTQVAATLMDYFVAFWVNLEQERENNLHTFSESAKKFFTNKNCLIIYGVLSSSLLLLCGIRLWSFTKFCMAASKQLHNAMLEKITKAKMDFFIHNTPGQILDRFSNDVGIIDNKLTFTLFEIFQLTVSYFSVAIYICKLNYWMIISTTVMFFLCSLSTYLYLRINRMVSENAITHRGPVLSYLAASVRGLPTIRAQRAQQILKKEFDNLQDVRDSTLHLQQICLLSFVFWMDIVGVVNENLIICVFAFSRSDIFLGNIGVVIMQALGCFKTLPFTLTQIAELNSDLVSVERVVEYSRLPSEPDEGCSATPKDWPQQGVIEFRSVSLKYSENAQYALKQVAFTVGKGEKIGIIGRTGAGKSSLVSVLFRLFSFEGSVIIDGVNTKDMPLNDLRSKISIIPQDPFLFSGTLRRNLDPLEQYSDAQIWKALEEVELSKKISGMALSLDSVVSEDGANISVGEKQLLCLARAILQSAKIIILDEATASVDLMTDELIQSTIRRKFSDSSVLTIAHRVNTVMDSDKILVMDDGTVAEFGRPNDLLQNRNSSFFRYVN